MGIGLLVGTVGGALIGGSGGKDDELSLDAIFKIRIMRFFKPGF
jgi:hypothetical protein